MKNPGFVRKARDYSCTETQIILFLERNTNIQMLKQWLSRGQKYKKNILLWYDNTGLYISQASQEAF